MGAAGNDKEHVRKYTNIDFDVRGTWEALNSSESIVFDMGVFMDTLVTVIESEPFQVIANVCPPHLEKRMAL